MGEAVTVEITNCGCQPLVFPSLLKSPVVTDASPYLGRGKNFIDQLIEHGRLRSVDGIATSGSRIDIRDLRKLKQEIEALMPAAEASTELGIGLGQFRELVRYKLLSPDNEFRVDGEEAKFSHQALSKFLDRIAYMVNHCSELNQHQAISLSQVSAHLERCDLSFGQFIEMLLEDFPSAIFESEGTPNSLSRFWIDSAHFHQYLNSRSKPARKSLAPLCTVPSLRGVVEWLERKEEEEDKRFYHYPDLDQLQLDGVLLLACYIETLCRLSAENTELLPEREIPIREMGMEN